MEEKNSDKGKIIKPMTQAEIRKEHEDGYDEFFRQATGEVRSGKYKITHLDSLVKQKTEEKKSGGIFNNIFNFFK